MTVVAFVGNVLGLLSVRRVLSRILLIRPSHSSDGPAHPRPAAQLTE